MLIDWVRIYQPSNKVNYGCDPKEFPTSAYIEALVLFTNVCETFTDTLAALTMSTQTPISLLGSKLSSHGLRTGCYSPEGFANFRCYHLSFGFTLSRLLHYQILLSIIV